MKGVWWDPERYSNPSIIGLYRFQYYSHREVFEEMLEFSNLVLSYHNSRNSGKYDGSLIELTSFSPKISQVSVMAHNEQDVLDLIRYTRGFKTLNPEQEYVTISMGKVRKISFVSWLTGSSWSYAKLEKKVLRSNSS